MPSGVLGVALAGLNAAQAGLQTTGHNLSNVNTPSYSRQQVLQDSMAGQFTGGGFMGIGVNVSDVKRMYADHLEKQAESLQAQSSQYATYSNQIDQLNRPVQ